MNAILKFKALRSVLKALNGTYFRSPKDPNVWINRETKKAYKSRRWRDADPNNHADDFDRYFEEYDDRPERFVSLGKTYVRQGDTYFNVDAQGHPVSEVSNPQFNWVRDATGNMRTLVKAKPVAKPQANTPVDAGAAVKLDVVVTNKPRGGVRPDYTAKFNGMNFTDEEKKYMTDAGFDPTNAKSVQEFILSKASNANLGARKGAGIADGYWGDKSAAAFQALRNQGIFTPKVDAQETPAPVIDEPVDAPDFGYSTNQDYSNGMQFKNLGFNNFQGLLRYAQGSNDQFAQDLRQRFGDRLSDQAYVEEQLGVSGKYRGGRAGDFGDIARSMQAWKSTTNQAFDDKRAAYSKKLLDARTGASGTVYSSPEIMRKFESIKVQPEIKWGLTPKTKFDFSNLKYNTDFGGASTLGDAGLGTLSTSQKQLAYADK